MRSACAAALAGAAVLAGCGEEPDHANRERPPSSINVTAAIADGRVNVSPERFGAGPIRLIVSNQTGSAQRLTFQTAGDASGVTETTRITPSGTATLEVEVTEGEYELGTADRAIEPAAVTVAAARDSAQDRLLLP